MMNKSSITKKIIILFISLVFSISAIKVRYGGEISLRLNEPDSFSFSPSNYSNMIFYSLIYENLFFLKGEGTISSNLFSSYKYEKSHKTLVLKLKKNLSFSNGDPILSSDVQESIQAFLALNLESAKKARNIVKSVYTREYQVLLELHYDFPGIVSLLTAPELVLLPGTGFRYSGLFYPSEKVQDKHIILKPNKHYPGGSSYLDSLKVVFYDFYYPDVFLGGPSQDVKNYNEFKGGVYQNIYILFPKKQVGQNTRIALFSLLRLFFEETGMDELNAFTSNDESPISLNIKQFPDYKIRKILKYSKIKLYIPNSLNNIEVSLKEFLQKKRIPLETIYLGDNQLYNFLNNDNKVEHLVLGKVFNKRMPIEAKVKKIIKELTFSRFNEKYLNLINELEEVEFLKNEEMLINHLSGIIEQIIKDGFLLPIAQERYSIYVNRNLQGIELDYYGRPLFQGVRLNEIEK